MPGEKVENLRVAENNSIGKKKGEDRPARVSGTKGGERKLSGAQKNHKRRSVPKKRKNARIVGSWGETGVRMVSKDKR